ncbi:MAG TPA: transposase [Candidatus Binatia bacterium]|nr:transposase [Candidatus Binatia bacterium]
MARPLRLEFANAVYHLTSRGNARQGIFFNDGDRELFLQTLAHVVSRYSWICHAYCLMANHYHLLIETPKANLSIGMRQLNGVFTQSFNRRHKRVGHLFQGRFKAVLVEKESYLLELCRYVVLNPVRVKGGTKTAAWKWSSYRATAGLASVPEFLSTDWLLEQFGKNRRVAQKRYREFVRDGITNRPWDQLKGQIYLGSDKFIERHSAEDRELKAIPRAQLHAFKPTLERIFARDGETGIGRAYREHGYRLQEIAAYLGVHYATVSRKLKKIEKRNY